MKSSAAKTLINIGLLAAATFGTTGSAMSQDRTIMIRLDNVGIRDEDDPLSKDEPYLVMTRFRMRIRAAGDTFSILPGTLQISTVMNGHNDLGYRSDNWAQERHTFPIAVGIPHAVQEVFPWNQEGWIAGAVFTFMEEDGFADSTALYLGRRIETAVRDAMARLRFTERDSAGISADVISKVMADIAGSIRKLDFGGAVRGLISAVDPDDFGGVQMAIAATLPGNLVLFNSGAPAFDYPTFLRTSRLIGTSMRFSLNFPFGDLSSLPGNAKFAGSAVLNGTVAVGRLADPF